MSRFDVFHMIKRRAKAPPCLLTCCHTFRTAGIPVSLEIDRTLQEAQTIANHESPRTTKLYDRRGGAGIWTKSRFVLNGGRLALDERRFFHVRESAHEPYEANYVTI
jgi:hypothetical protein